MCEIHTSQGSAISGRGVVPLLAASGLLLVFWSLAVPIFEAPDEPAHWQYARYLHQNLKLPPYDRSFVEGNQPPLYYLLISPFARHTDLPPLLAKVEKQGHLVSPSPPKFFEHSNNDFTLYWPIRTARLVTALISLFAVLFSYLAGLEATGDHGTGLLAASLVAFLPQFTFRGTNVSNDALVTTMCAGTVYLLVRLLKRGFTWPLGLSTAAMIGVAFLSKVNAIFLPIPFALVVLAEPRPFRDRLARLGTLSIGLLIAAPWALRNQILYGDPVASRAMLEAVDFLVDRKPITSPYFVTSFPSVLARSFIGVFGWMNLWLSEWIYGLFGLLALLAMCGYVCRVLGGRLDRRLILILLTIPLLSVAITVHINLSFTQAQGRYLFPALSAIALLVAMGLEGLSGWSRWSTYLLVGMLAILNLYVLIAVVLPAYWSVA